VFESLHILAQRSSDDNDGGWIKFVFGAIFFIIWIVSALGTWLNKKHEEERRRRLREQLNQGTAPPPRSMQAPSPRPPPMRVGQPAPPRAPKRFPQRAPKPPRQPAQRSRAVPGPPPVPVAQAASDSTTHSVAATEISALKVGAHARGATATSIARWLRPDTLRQQFILTEILQPPLALREPRDVR
jgi:hypothetical protein